MSSSVVTVAWALEAEAEENDPEEELLETAEALVRALRLALSLL